jgi:hypothetical protein
VYIYGSRIATAPRLTLPCSLVVEGNGRFFYGWIRDALGSRRMGWTYPVKLRSHGADLSKGVF